MNHLARTLGSQGLMLVDAGLQERVRLAALGADVGAALTQEETLSDMLRRCTEAVVQHLDAAFARIWTLQMPENVLQLQASAGLYTHLDGRHGRVPMGQLKIGRIAQERQPHLTNDVLGDPRVNDQEWARREGMIAFAGYPLMVGTRLEGVMAMFARQPLTDATLEALAAIANTIALGIERKRAETILRRSEERFRSLVEGSLQGLVIQRHFKALFVNQAYADIFGYTPEEILAMDSTLQLFAPHEHARLRAYHEARLRGESISGQYEWQGVHKDGTLLCGESLVRLVEWEGQPATQATLLDITARKRAEAAQEYLSEQLRQAQKLEAIGTLAGGIAHDFNNILGAILGYTELALDVVPAHGTAWGYLQEVQVAGLRAKELVQQILTFSRQAEQERKPIVLRPIVQEALMLLRASLPTTIEIDQHLATETGTILAAPAHIHQIVMNLCTNAAHAMQDAGGQLEARLEDVEVDAPFACRHGRQPGPYVHLSIRDTGHGMAPEVLERIFEPFFTTKGKGEGTGLGLAVVYGIVADHEGMITVESSLGQGTTFDVYLPRQTTAASEVTPPPSPAPRGEECILFVDDEPALARLGRELLTRLGYDVVVRTSSVEALEAFRAVPQRYDLVITDQTMPQMTGEVLARELRRLRPDVPIILCTGFSHTMTAERAQALGLDALCLKPLVTRDLGRTIRRVLDRRAAAQEAPADAGRRHGPSDEDSGGL